MKFATVILALCLTPGLAAQEPPAVPFHLIEGWAIVLEGTLAAIPNCRIMIDTGAVPSAINSKFVKRLGLTGASQRLSIMSRSVNAQKLRVPEVRIGPVSAESLDMMAVDLDRIEQRLGTRIDAVIGLDFLAKRNFRLDYRHKKLVFTSNPDAYGAGAIPFEMEHEAGGAYILLPLRNDGQNLQVLLDTGTKDLTLFDRRISGKLRRLRVLGVDSNVTAAGRDPLVAVQMDAIHVGPVFREKQKAFVLTNSEEDSQRFDGILGPAALGAIAVAFDFDRHIVSLETR
jgi:predicted aspartyl protease